MKNSRALLEDITGTELAAGLPPGRTWRCRACGTRIRTGQPHSAARPYGHGTVEALIARAVTETELEFAAARVVQG